MGVISILTNHLISPLSVFTVLLLIAEFLGAEYSDSRVCWTDQRKQKTGSCHVSFHFTWSKYFHLVPVGNFFPNDQQSPLIIWNKKFREFRSYVTQKHRNWSPQEVTSILVLKSIVTSSKLALLLKIENVTKFYSNLHGRFRT